MGNWERKRRGGMWLWTICLAAVFAQTSLHLIRPVTSYKVLELGGSATTIGVVTAVYALFPVLVASYIGRLSDSASRLGRWTVLGIGIMAFGSGQLVLARETALMIVGSALLGVGHIVMTICLQAVIARRALQGGLEAGFGWFTAANSVGQMIGPFLGGRLVDAGPSLTGGSAEAIDLALMIGVTLALLTVPIILAGRREFTLPVRASTFPQCSGHQPRSAWSLIRMPRVGVILYCSLGFVALVDVLAAFMPLIGEEKGISPTAIGALLAIRGGASIISRAVLPWLTARYSSQQLLVTSLFGSALCFALMPFLLDLMWLAVLLTLVGGFVMGIGQPVTMGMISTAVPFERRGQALAVRLMSSRLGQVVIPLGAGCLAGALGPSAAVQLSAFVLFTAAGVSSTRGQKGP